MIFSYKVECYNYDEQPYYTYTATGLSICSNWRDAVSKLEAQYGKELVEILSLYLMEDSPTITLPEEVVERYKNTEFPELEFQKKKKLG